jgi:hypothetical protein
MPASIPSFPPTILLLSELPFLILFSVAKHHPSILIIVTSPSTHNYILQHFFQVFISFFIWLFNVTIDIKAI